jgi:hypothetical protein
MPAMICSRSTGVDPRPHRGDDLDGEALNCAGGGQCDVDDGEVCLSDLDKSIGDRVAVA